MSRLGDKIAHSTRNLCMAVIGGVFALVGLAFLTSAGWSLIALVYGGPMASLAIGGIYLGVGLLIFTLRPSPPPPAPPAATGQSLAGAFLSGFESGRCAHR